MRNKATICRIDCVGCGYCACTWNTSYCNFCFTFGSCGIFLITNTWLKWGNNNCGFSAIWTGNVFPYCWSKNTCTGIDRVSCSLLNHIIAFFEVCNLILSWDFDHCRFWWDFHCWSFMRNKATICRIDCVGCGYCSCTWNTSYCDFCFTFVSCGIFLITNTWLKWCNGNCRFGTIFLEHFIKCIFSNLSCIRIFDTHSC